MKHPRIYVAIAVLIFPMLACQAVMGRGGSEMESVPPTSEGVNTQPPQVQPMQASTAAPAAQDTPGGSPSTRFPMTPDAYNIVEVTDGSLIYYTKLPAEEAMKFYRDQYTSQGYTERENLTLAGDGLFSMVFDGDPSGKSVVIQSVDMGDGSRTISLRLENV